MESVSSPGPLTGPAAYQWARRGSPRGFLHRGMRMGAVPCETPVSAWVQFNDTKQQETMNDFYCSYTYCSIFAPETKSNIFLSSTQRQVSRFCRSISLAQRQRYFPIKVVKATLLIFFSVFYKVLMLMNIRLISLSSNLKWENEKTKKNHQSGTKRLTKRASLSNVCQSVCCWHKTACFYICHDWSTRSLMLLQFWNADANFLLAVLEQTVQGGAASSLWFAPPFIRGSWSLSAAGCRGCIPAQWDTSAEVVASMSIYKDVNSPSRFTEFPPFQIWMN